MTELADALLSAHIEHELARLRGAALGELLESQVAAAFEWLEDVKFNDIVTRAQIMGVIDRYVVELKVSGGITELAGEMSRVVFSSTASTTTRVGDVVPTSAYEDFADKIGTLRGAQGEVIRYVTGTSAFGPLTSRLVSRLVTELVFGWDRERSLPSPAFPLADIMETLARRVLPHLERRVGEALSRYLEPHATRFSKESGSHVLGLLEPESELVRQLADEIWDEVSRKPLSEAVAVFSAQDLEDFVVLGYEFWQKFRKTEYFHTVSAEVVDRLFDKYGEESVLALILDMGVSEPMVTEELKTFLGPLLEHAFTTGFLEQQLRSLLEPFYHSPALIALLPR